MVKLLLKKREQELWFHEWSPTILKLGKEDYINVKFVNIRRVTREKRGMQLLAEMFYKNGYCNEQCLEKAMKTWSQQF